MSVVYQIPDLVINETNIAFSKSKWDLLNND